MNTGSNKTRKRNLKISLRLMFAVVTLASVLLAVWVYRAETQRKAISRIVGLGGEYCYDTTISGYGDTDKNFFASTVARLLGPDFAYTVVVVDFRRTEITDSDLSILDDLRSIRVLTLASPTMRGEGLRYVGRLKSLVFLDLSHCNVDDNSLKHLVKLTSLETLNLNQAQLITDSGLEHVRDLPKLADLSCVGTSATQK